LRDIRRRASRIEPPANETEEEKNSREMDEDFDPKKIDRYFASIG
jgi:hypothetical protein